MSFVKSLYLRAAEYAHAEPKTRTSLLCHQFLSLREFDDHFLRGPSFVPYNQIAVLIAFSRSFFHSGIVPNFAMRSNALNNGDQDTDVVPDENNVILILHLLRESSTLQFASSLHFLPSTQRFVTPHSNPKAPKAVAETLLHLINNSRYFSRSLQSLTVSFPFSDDEVETILCELVGLRELVLGHFSTSSWPPIMPTPRDQVDDYYDDEERENEVEKADDANDKHDNDDARELDDNPQGDSFPLPMTAKGVSLLCSVVVPRLDVFELNLNFVKDNGKCFRNRITNGFMYNLQAVPVAVEENDEYHDDEDGGVGDVMTEEEKQRARLEQSLPFDTILDAIQQGKFSKLVSLALTNIEQAEFGKKLFSLVRNASSVLPRLRILNVRNSRCLSQLDVAAVGAAEGKNEQESGARQLDSLNLSDCAQIGFAADADVLSEALAHFTNLRVLRVGQYVDDGEKFALRLDKFLPFMPSLEILSLHQLNIDDSCYKALEHVQDTLRELRLSLNCGLGDEAVAQHICRCKNLEWLDISYAGKVGDEAVATVFESLKKLRYFDCSTFGDFNNALTIRGTIETTLLGDSPIRPTVGIRNLEFLALSCHGGGASSNENVLTDSHLLRIREKIPTLKVFRFVGKNEVDQERTKDDKIHKEGLLKLCLVEEH